MSKSLADRIEYHKERLEQYGLHVKIQSESVFMISFFMSFVLMLAFLIIVPFRFLFSLLKLFKPSEFQKEIFNIIRDIKRAVISPIKIALIWFFQAKATFFLITLNAIAFVIQIYFLFTKGTLVPENLVFNSFGLLKFKFLNMVISWFLHGSVFHLLGNMLFLFVFGRVVERTLGPAKTFLIYFGSAIISSIGFSLIYILLRENVWAIGASGAIAGLVSAAILLNPFYITYLVFAIPIPISFAGWLAMYTDISGILYPKQGDTIGHFAHLSGYLGIMLLMLLFNREEKEQMKKGLFVNIGLLVLVIFFYLFLLKRFYII